MLKALGDPTRLQIFEFLVRCQCAVAVDDSGGVSVAEGPSAGQVCCHVTGVSQITSSVSFHLKELRNAGLIAMDKRGKNMVCAPRKDSLRTLADYFASLEQSTCCKEK
ncbi:MAG: winged helix-turn-helix transcriptional regulator [Chthonomonadaceae bacterium]|nr:winged helix-turn-helix transcriptional regulator [Chthonomonadaceae bacterium]